MKTIFSSTLTLILALFLISSCKKDVIVIPEACFEADKTNVNVGDTITFTNCSIADDVSIFFPKLEAEHSYTGITYQFDSDNTFKYKFDKAGTYIAKLRAVNNKAGTPIQHAREVIIVQ